MLLISVGGITALCSRRAMLDLDLSVSWAWLSLDNGMHTLLISILLGFPSEHHADTVTLQVW